MSKPDRITWLTGNGVIRLSCSGWLVISDPFQAINALHATAPPNKPGTGEIVNDPTALRPIETVPGPGVFL